MIKWTDDLVEVVKQGLLDGLSATSIAKLIGRECSRNSVIGKVRRTKELRAIGFAKQQPSANPRERFNGSSKSLRLHLSSPKPPKKQNLPQLKREPIQDDVITQEPPLLLSLAQLNTRTCKYPIGDPRSEGFGFCGHAKLPQDGPYCKFHHSKTRIKWTGRRR